MAEVDKSAEFRRHLSGLRSNASDANKIAWVLYGHVPGNYRKIELVSKDISNKATLEDFVQALDDNSAMYGLVRVPVKVDDICMVKFIYINW